MSLDLKMLKDTETILNFIENHNEKESIISMYHKGPQINTGFMFSDPDSDYWTKKEGEALKIMENKVVNLGWDSSGYGIMQRNIQKNIKEKYPLLYINMDNDNKKIMDIWKNKCVDEAVKAMFKDVKTGKQLSYSEMRMKYG